jgi:hypothetical protein
VRFAGDWKGASIGYSGARLMGGMSVTLWPSPRVLALWGLVLFPPVTLLGDILVSAARLSLQTSQDQPVLQVIGDCSNWSSPAPYYRATEHEEKSRSEVLRYLQEALARDLVIRRDSITSQRLGCHDITGAYLHWLHMHSRAVALSHVAVRLDQFVYQRPQGSNPSCCYAFSGGEKWWSTMSVLFGLAEEKCISTFLLDPEYYERSGILTIRTGGNHRLLAQVLWGGQFQFGDVLQVREEDQGALDCRLRASLATIERHLAGQGAGTLVGFEPERPEHVELVKNLVSALTTEEWEVLSRFLAHCRDGSRRCGWHRGSPEWLAAAKDDLRAIRMQQPATLHDDRPGRLSRWYQAIKSHLPKREPAYHEDFRTPLERWLDNGERCAYSSDPDYDDD